MKNMVEEIKYTKALGQCSIRILGVSKGEWFLSKTNKSEPEREVLQWRLCTIKPAMKKKR